MKQLPLNIIVDENRRLGEIKFGPKEIYSLYDASDGRENFYVVTDSEDSGKIYMVIDRELWAVIFEQKSAGFNIKNW